MENKLKINKLGKIGTLIPAVLAAGMLNCAAATFHNTPNNSKSTSSTNQTLVYQKAAEKYSEKKTVKTMTDLINSDLNKMKGYDKLEAKVQSEVAGYIADMNANSLELAHLYKALEDNTVANSGLTPQEMDKIAINKGVGTSDQVNMQVVGSAAQHFGHIAVGGKTVPLFGANDAVIKDEGDGKNEYLQLIANGKYDSCEAATAILNAFKTDILNYTQYGYAVNGQDGKKMADQIAKNLDKINSLVSQSNFNQTHYQALLNTINQTADILHGASFWGTLAMCRGLVVEYASQYSLNHLTNHLKGLGYDINNLNFDSLAKKDITLTPSATFNATNKHAGIGLGFTATKPLGQNWDISYGGEIDFNKGYNGGANSIQLFGTAAGGKTLNNGDHVSVGTKAGLQFDAKGVSVPFGFDAGYTRKINEKFSLYGAVGAVANINRALADIGATIGATYRTKSGVMLKFGVGLGYTFDWNKETSTTTTPTPNPTPNQPTVPTYGEDEVIKPAPDTTVDLGNIHDLPEKPVDLTLF